VCVCLCDATREREVAASRARFNVSARDLDRAFLGKYTSARSLRLKQSRATSIDLSACSVKVDYATSSSGLVTQQTRDDRIAIPSINLRLRVAVASGIVVASLEVRRGKESR
jgi:hypothetical protein